MQDALANGEMVPVPQFLKATQSIYYKSWGSVPWAVAGWALKQIGLTGGPGDTMPKGQVVVVLQNLEAIAKAFSDAAAGRTAPFERIFSRTHFRRTFEGNLLKGQQRLSDSDLDVMLKFLSRDKGVLVTDGNTIKIRDPAETAATISEEDAAIASLKELTEDLTRQTDALSRRVDELAVAAADAVRRKNRVAALAALRSKKLAEGTLSTRHATLHRLEEVAAQIQQAADNVQLVRVMRSSAGALRSLNAQVGDADTVDAVLDDLREQMSQVDEVGNVISEVGAGVVDEGEVDDELEAMLNEEREKEEAAERIKQEAKETREAEETRRRLAEIEKLGPTPAGANTKAPVLDADGRPLTPVSAAASVLSGMHIDSVLEDSEKQDREKVGAI